MFWLLRLQSAQIGHKGHLLSAVECHVLYSIIECHRAEGVNSVLDFPVCTHPGLKALGTRVVNERSGASSPHDLILFGIRQG